MLDYILIFDLKEHTADAHKDLSVVAKIVQLPANTLRYKLNNNLSIHYKQYLIARGRVHKSSRGGREFK